MKKLFGFLILFSACAVWGASFVPQRTAMEHIGPFTLGGARFLLGALCILPVALIFKSGPLFTRVTIRRGTLLGALLFLASSAQQIGMQYTTATNGGFITGFYLVFVPLMLTLFYGRPQSKLLWIGAIISFIGLALLSLTADFQINPGDLWILLCALLFAQSIIITDGYVDQTDPLALAFMQFVATGLFSAVFALIFESGRLAGIEIAVPEILYLGIVSVGFAYTVALYGQKLIPPSEVALIFSLEAVFAAAAGWYFLSETLSTRQLAGAGIMFLGLLLACLQMRTKS